MKRAGIGMVAVGVALLMLAALLLVVSVPPMASTLPGNDIAANNATGAISNNDGGDSGGGDAPWPMFSHDLRHTGRSPYDTSGNVGRELWRCRGGAVKSSPSIGSDGTVYVGSWNKLYAVNPDGTIEWKFRAPYRSGHSEEIASSPAVGADGTVYVGSWNGYFYAVDSTGELKWRFDTRDTIDGSAAVGPDGTVYFGVVETTEVGTFYALYPNGTEKWRFETGRRIYGSPAIGDDGTIYIGSNDGYLYALYPNGSLRWRYKTGDCVQSSPAIDDDGTIYVGSWDSYLYALSPDGSLKWRYKTGAAIDDSSPALYGDTIYVGSYDGYLYALRSDGSLKWRFKTGTSIIASPAVDSNGIVYISSMDGKLYALNPDGTERWSEKMLSDKGYYACYIESSPAIGDDGTIYVGSWFQGGEHTENLSWGYLHAIRNGTAKGIEIVKPADGGLYLFNLKLLGTQDTYVIGGIRVKTDIISPEQVERVEYCVDGKHRYTDTSRPFTWRWNDRAFTPYGLFELHHLSVTAHYNDGDIVASQYRNALLLNPFGRPTATGNDDNKVVAPPPLLSPDARYAHPRQLAKWPGASGCPYGMAP